MNGDILIHLVEKQPPPYYARGDMVRIDGTRPAIVLESLVPVRGDPLLLVLALDERQWVRTSRVERDPT